MTGDPVRNGSQQFISGVGADGIEMHIMDFAFDNLESPTRPCLY